MSDELVSIEDAITSNIKRRGRCSNKRDKRLDEAKHHVKGEKWSETKKMEVVAYYMVLGTLKKTSDFTGVGMATIQSWRQQEWWGEALKQIRTEHNDEIDSAMTGIMQKALAKIDKMVDDGEVKYNPRTETFYNLPVGIKDLSIAAAITFDKRQLLRGQATQRVEKVTVNERLDDLSERFKAFANAKEIDGEVEIIKGVPDA